MKQKMLDFVPWMSKRSGCSQRHICGQLGLVWSRYQRWRRLAAAKQSLADGHGGGNCLGAALPWEREAVIEFALKHPTDGYRYLTWQMIDEDVACLSESSVYRILASEGLLCRWTRPPRPMGDPPPKPNQPHQRWHTDIMHLRLADRWYFLVSFIDAYSRYIVHWELLTSMTASDITLAQLAALEKYPAAKPEIVTDHGSQYTSKEYAALVKRFELNHVLCRIAHPQSNGIIERYHRSTREALQQDPAANLLQARELIEQWVTTYNENRLHAGLGYIQPHEYFQGDPASRKYQRQLKLKRARKLRQHANKQRLTANTQTRKVS